MQIIKLIVSIAICQLAGIIGSFFTVSSVDSWYLILEKPILNPPSWVFGLVWVILYVLMGISLFLIWQKEWKKKEIKLALGVFGVQLVLNTAWSMIFFGAQSPFWALIEIVLLWLLIIVTMIMFSKLSKPAMFFLIPYVAWVSFAMYLNFEIWRLN